MNRVFLKLQPASSKWYNIGLGLNLDVDTLDNIQHSNANDQDDCLRECLTIYLQKATPSWSDIVNALKQRSVRHSALALEIQEEIGKLFAVA